MSMDIQLNNVQDAVLFVAQCNEYTENIDYKFDHYIVDAKSLMGVISAGFGKKCNVLINTDDSETLDRFMKDMKMWRSNL